HCVTMTATTYASGRRILDADSHLMELPGFLDPFIDDAMRERLKGRSMAAVAALLDRATAAAKDRSADGAVRAEAEGRLFRDKGWNAMGAFDPSERSHVLDLLGFEAQLVFATFATAMFVGKDIDLLYAGSHAHNLAVADFCKGDARLLPVGFVPLADPERAESTLRGALDAGCDAIHVPSTAAGERSPSHPDLDGFWSLLEESGKPFVLHVGGGGRLLDRAFHNNGRPVTDHLGGGENIRSKDYLCISHSPSLFLGTLILDGVFDLHPNLRGGVIEEGASWVVSWMHQLDFAQRSFRRTEAPLTTLELKPSDYVRRNLKFTPFPGEPVGWMIEQAGDGLFMFSTDYPHPEGGKDPLAKFEDAMVGTPEPAKQRFYFDNMADLVGQRRVELVGR
ncbi:MAG TPA: amidohydrolase family protein, partial [Acidimicrobiales bacterium]|nr:amidohydrolase family protein [Acidimicrobiales bacterium]